MKDRCRKRRVFHAIRALAFAVAIVALGLMQKPDLLLCQDTTSGTTYTFHINEDLVQVPALVIDRASNSYNDLGPAGFTVRLDSGPPFHPRHLRVQGDDPLHVMLFLDLGSGHREDLAAVGGAPWPPCQPAGSPHKTAS